MKTLLLLCILVDLAFSNGIPPHTNDHYSTLEMNSTNTNTSTNPSIQVEMDSMNTNQYGLETGNKCESAQVYEHHANQYKRKGDIDTANNMINRAAILFEMVGREQKMAPDCSYPSAYRYAANVYKELGNTTKAIEMLQLAAPAYEQEGSNFLEKKDYRIASSYYRYAASVYKELNNTAKYIEILGQLAPAYEQTVNSQNEEYFIKAWYCLLAANAFKEIGNIDKANEMYFKSSDMYYYMAHRLYILGDIESAELYYDRSASISEKLGRRDMVISVYAEAAITSRYFGDKNKTEEFLSKAEALKEQ